MQKTCSEQFLIRSYQADLNNRLTPAALLQLMQEMAGVHAERIGVGREAMLRHNVVWVLTRVEVRMERMPLSGETISVETFPMPNRRWFCPRYFIFRDEQGHQLGCAGSLWVLLDVKERKMCAPGRLIACMPDNSDLTAPMGMPATVADAPGEPVSRSIAPQYTDLDVNGHVNNTRYVDWCCNALGVEAMRGHTMLRFAVNFNQEVLPGQTVEATLRRSGDAFSFSGWHDGKRLFDVGGEISAL